MANTIKIGSIEADAIKIGTSTVSKVYVGTELVYPTDVPHDYSHDYLTFVAEADNMSVGLSSAGNNVYQYSVDSGTTWSDLANSGSTISVNSGQTIRFKASGLTISSGDGIGTLKPSVSASVQGNVMSLVYGEDFTGQTTINNYQFIHLFYQCTNLTNASNLVLPSTTLKISCYQYMFEGCTSLTATPELPATTLDTNCYNGMFANCNGLTAAPELSATTLVNNCYQYMFYNCTSLNYVKCLATSKNSNSTNNWLNGVAATGTFVKDASMTGWSTGVSGIPSGWTIENA